MNCSSYITSEGEQAPPVLEPYKLEKNEWKDGLLVRSPNWLGDAVMTLPAMHQLKKIIPDTCGLFVLCPPGLKPFFELIPAVNKTIALHKAHALWNGKDIREVRHLYAGAGLLFNNSLRDSVFMRYCGIKRLFGAAARSRGFLLKKSWPFPKRKSAELNKLHHAAKYLSMAYALGAPEWDGSYPEFKLSPEPETFPENFHNAISSGKLLSVAGGAAYGESKRWPAEYFNEVCRIWIQDGGSVAALGSNAERDICEKIIKDLPKDKAFNLAGETTLPELAFILSKSEAATANDSGIMHLAAALGIGGVAIFGSTDPSATSPVSKKWTVLYEKEECSPCFTRECPSGSYNCMKKISPAKVTEELKKISL